VSERLKDGIAVAGAISFVWMLLLVALLMNSPVSASKPAELVIVYETNIEVNGVDTDICNLAKPRGNSWVILKTNVRCDELAAYNPHAATLGYSN